MNKRPDKIEGKGSDLQKELIQLSHNIWLTLTVGHRASCTERCSENTLDTYYGRQRKATMRSDFQ